MSHLGLRILYNIINQLPYASAERFFSPWIDMEEYMKKNNILLSSLESHIPLKDFDIVGFSLQYELSYTTVLNMLYLGGIPIKAEGRFDAKKNFPLIIAGGPCTVNPSPMSAFIDVFLVGDGEDAVVELLNVVRQWKLSGDSKRETLLKEISKLKGFYVPYIHTKISNIKRRFVLDLDNALYPVRPIVPYTSIVHDRINIEVSRGCTMGCRFCQAGMIYRPLRERSPENVLKITEESLKNTGYDEVSFSSLSAGDYSHLLDVIKKCNKKFGKSKIAISLPSLRVGAVNQDILREIKSIRKTGFTIAPEAATERLRNVINKNFSVEDYEKALNALFNEGWMNLKLYFMIGLPTETDRDIEAIRDMAIKALHIAKKNIGRFVNISITVSPFVPKPHTPFQWYGQISLDEIKRRQGYLRDVLSSKKFKYKGHDECMSFLEAVFSRGDKKLSLLIEKAWESGCRLDGWSEMFDFNKWLDAMNRTGIDGSFYAQRSFGKDEELPWDNIDIGIKKSFLYKEYERSLSGQTTQDCRKVCTACGLKCDKSEALNIKCQESNKEISDNNFQILNSKFENQDMDIRNSKHNNSQSSISNSRIKVRVQFSKTGKLRYLSHLELVTAIHRGLRRAGVPFDFSKGFHPTPKISFGPPLNVGIASEKEYFDMEVFTPFDIEFYIKELNETMTEGIKINKMKIIPMDAPSLNSFIKRYEYKIKCIRQDAIKCDLLPIASFIAHRDGKDIDISPCIENISFLEDGLITLTLRDTHNIKVRIGEIVKAILGVNMNELEITRTALYGCLGENNEWVEPL
ncbi:B12-binding protein [Dissulfurispira thermophila]|uniref:B12-binding protein n=2 Tax=root TaxID=1 RepID=A0A7G1GZC3_9BACT|nr:B12-binding protein [Dissulfurispira thermophila]